MPNRLYAEWVEKLHRITRELYSTHYYRELWRGLVEITQSADLPPSVVFDALGVWYGGTQAVAMRRQLDDTKGVVSLRRLLGEIARHLDVITRERHVALWGDPEFKPRRKLKLRPILGRLRPHRTGTCAH